jgi:hypothetical protein
MLSQMQLAYVSALNPPPEPEIEDDEEPEAEED